LGDAFSGTISGLKSDNLRYSVGPMLELNLPLGFGAEFNALFKKTEASAANTLGSFHSREFPLVAKYKFPGVLVRPYLAAGYNYRSLGDVVSFLRSIPARGSLIDKTSSHGVVVGAGFRVNAVAIKISPELRFTRWNNGGFTLADTALSRNQAELLIGITF
jgi:opacity protein-like surface antigen